MNISDSLRAALNSVTRQKADDEALGRRLLADVEQAAAELTQALTGLGYALWVEPRVAPAWHVASGSVAARAADTLRAPIDLHSKVGALLTLQWCPAHVAPNLPAGWVTADLPSHRCPTAAEAVRAALANPKVAERVAGLLLGLPREQRS